jgi:O-acetyl-ADP-ribose deacetylase
VGPRITVELGDITRSPADAIVNAANTSLTGGGGVDGAIHRVGGPTVLEACQALRSGRFRRGLPTGEAVATVAGNLPARWVIHTVGPVWSATEDRSHLLAAAYRSCLRVADDLDARTVTFPAVSAGVYRWPMEDAARLAIGTVENSPTRVGEARFVLLTPAAYEIFAEALARRSIR